MKITVCLLFLFLAVTGTGICQSTDFISSNLPIVVINTMGQTILDDPKINVHMGIIYNGAGVRNSLSDPFNNYNGNIGIEYRGQTSQMFPMKSYGIELRDGANISQDKALLGIAKESDWILYAPYNDKTLMRNVLTYALANKLGRWASQCRYVELVIDKEYRGIYVLMEKIKRGANRVNISKLGMNDNTGDAVTGGYIISIDKDSAAFTSKYPPPYATGNQINFSNVYPKAANSTPQQNGYIKSYIDSFETALYGPDYQDPDKGVRKYADLPSFTDYFLINELSHNVDAYRLSTYMYKDKNSVSGKLTMGPVWDYDLSFRNADYCDGSNSDTWAYRFNAICPNDQWEIPFWWNKLLNDTAFEAALKCRYTSLRQTIFSTPAIYTVIDSIQNLLAEAQVRHFAKWPVLGQYVWPNPSPIPTSYTGEIMTLKNWIQDRTSWLDTNIPNTGACSTGSNANDITIKILPNPIISNGQLVLVSNTPQTISLTICNATGQTVVAVNTVMHTGENYLQHLPFYKWQKGVYFVRVTTSDGKKAGTTMLLMK